MLKKKKCQNCDERIKSSYNFCPNCGVQLRETSKDWGMLGKNDTVKQNFNEPKMLGGISGNILNKLMSKVAKDLSKMQGDMTERDMQEAMKSLFPGVKVTVKKSQNPMMQNSNKKDENKEDKKMLPIEFSEKNLKKWSNSKKEEPSSKLKRIGDKIQYEIEVPGVNSIKDISILKLENGIEIKAIAEEKAYQKTIPIDLPLKKFTLLREKLTLELDASM